MGSLENRVAIVTGAGRGIGRSHALLLAAEGAKVVVNDLGGSNTGEGADVGPAQHVVDEIRAAGGVAVANTDSVADFDSAAGIVEQAVSEFGGLDIVVNNAGILRDAFVPGMTEAQWDSVIGVHLKGHFNVLHHAAAYWKDQSKAGNQPNAAVINTASASGTFSVIPGQANYGAAKAGIAAMTLVAAEELERYGVRVNAIAPYASDTRHARHGRNLRRRGGRRGVRRLQSGQCVTDRGLPCQREVPIDRAGTGRSRRCGVAAAGLDDCRERRSRRALGT